MDFHWILQWMVEEIPSITDDKKVDLDLSDCFVHIKGGLDR